MNRTAWMLVAVSLGLVPTSAVAQRDLTTVTRVNLRTGSNRSSAVKRVLPAGTHLLWTGAMSDREGMLKAVTANPPRHTGWVAGEYLVEGAPAAGQHGAAAGACGVLRWPVKTMSDADANAVNRTPAGVTIASLRALVAPKVRPQNARANAVEKTEFGVSGQVIMWGQEADQDLHLVLADEHNASRTIVLEVPDPSCVSGASAAVRDSIGQARQNVIQALGTPPQRVTALTTPVRVTVTGVGFFDFGHSIGHPPNAFELHPVLSIRLRTH